MKRSSEAVRVIAAVRARVVLYSIRKVRCEKRLRGWSKTHGGEVPAHMSMIFHRLTQSIRAIDMGPSPPREEGSTRDGQ